MSKPRPIHSTHRDLRLSPDDAEPSFSYEESSFLGSSKFDDVEDEFHRRLAAASGSSSRRSESSSGATQGGSFWRTSTTASADSERPSFSSMSIQKTTTTTTTPEKAKKATTASSGQNTRKSTGLLGALLQSKEAADARKNDYRRNDSSLSAKSTQSNTSSITSPRAEKATKKTKDVRRAADRRLKYLAQSSEVDRGHVVENSSNSSSINRHEQEATLTMTPPSSPMNHHYHNISIIAEHSGGTSTSLERSSSDQSTGSSLVFYGKTPNSVGAASSVLGKSSSLIFPTHGGGGMMDGSMTTQQQQQSPVVAGSASTVGGGGSVGESPSVILSSYSSNNAPSSSNNAPSSSNKQRQVNLRLDQCDAVRFPFKKKLMLNNLSLTAADIPLQELVGTSLGQSLHKLSLSGNALGTVPALLVQSLPNLKHLDLSQCNLHQLPDVWDLPKLMRLNLSHNQLTDFPEEGMLEGIPELHELNMYGNKVAEIIIPSSRKFLGKLETLNLGYNDLAYLPDELDQITTLKTLKVMNNFLEKVPMRVCEMDLRYIDVSSNPVLQPPIETCERGICSMKRYYHCLRMEEQSKQKALEEVQKKAHQKQKKKESKKKGCLIKSPPLSKQPPALKPSSRHKSDDSHSSSVASSSSSMAIPEPLQTLKMAAVAVPPPQAKGPEQVAKLFPEKPAVKTSRLQRPFSSSEEVAAATGAVDSLLELQPPLLEDEAPLDQVTVNDTLKVIFVGMAMVGKTSIIMRLMKGKDADIPTHQERTVGVDIYEWDPKKDRRFQDIDSRICFQDKQLAETCGDVDVKFSVWDFAGQHVYHATHELFFSPRALYVLVWDMGATNRATLKRKASLADETGTFRLTYDSSDDEGDGKDNEEDDPFAAEEEARRADRALEHDIDEKVQFWVDCIQSSAPGAAILPVASFSDYFDNEGGEAEAKRRCNMLKQRLLKHEERRIKGIKQRLKEFEDQNRADDLAAIRLRKLLCSYTRPKLILGDGDDSVVRVSGTQYSGFKQLSEKIISIATGREKGQWRYPIFHGHIGARIPRMRLEVRECVRTMRDRLKVVEWGYFINQLRDRGLTNVEDISDALHFLTNIGELSYFGCVMAISKPVANPLEESISHPVTHCDPGKEKESATLEETKDDEDEIDDEDEFDDYFNILSMDDANITVPSTEVGTLSTVEDFMSTGLSQFVFLNPRWLVAAVACILRHDLDREIKETRRSIATGRPRRLEHGSSFYDAQLNCPVITAEDACLLWQTKRITKKAAERAQEYSNDMTVTPFEFLQLLLIRFGVFVPIDLSVEKAFLGGKEYAHVVESTGSTDASTGAPADVKIDSPSDETSKFFFLPSLLGPCEPSDAWTYKSSDSWKTTLCHSILFPDGVPPGLMERLTASVLSSIYAVAHRKAIIPAKDFNGRDILTFEGQLRVKEILCWRTAFFLKLGSKAPASDGSEKESIVEIFTHIADRESHLCVGSDYMGVGMRRLIVSARGQVGDGGRKIWKGGYLLVLKSCKRVMDAYGGLEYEKQGFCPECLSKKAVSEASAWELTTVRSAVMNLERSLRCQHGHQVDTRFIAGPHDTLQKTNDVLSTPDPAVPVRDLLRAVVLVGLWDGEKQKVVRVGSGFVVDRKRGLIVTASHTLMNIWGDKKSPFGENYYGLRQGKVVIGVIPVDNESGGPNARDKAVFRYFANIVARDPDMDKGECHIDACVLRITTRMENDVDGDGEGCGAQPEKLLLNNPRALRNEHLQSLKITEKCELDEQVRILGYNQGGEGLIAPGEILNRYADFARGYVCKRFAPGEESGGGKLQKRFKPRAEIVVICPTIGGHSGGPCVNQQGEVIGILSRADPAQEHRCYICPTSEWRALVKEAHKALRYGA